MNMTEIEKYDALIQKYEPEPDKSEAYKEFMEERFLREREVVEGTVEQYNLCKKDTLLRRLGSRLDEERTGIKNLLLKAIGISGAEVIDFGTLGSVNWSERKGAKNRTFTIRIKEVPTEDQVEKEFKKINLEAY
jgi:hypothetical protein